MRQSLLRHKSQSRQCNHSDRVSSNHTKGIHLLFRLLLIDATGILLLLKYFYNVTHPQICNSQTSLFWADTYKGGQLAYCHTTSTRANHLLYTVVLSL